MRNYRDTCLPQSKYLKLHVPSRNALTLAQALYNTTAYVPKATATNKLGVAGYLQEFANDAGNAISFH
jgi:hypothetical protein